MAVQAPVTAGDPNRFGRQALRLGIASFLVPLLVGVLFAFAIPPLLLAVIGPAIATWGLRAGRMGMRLSREGVATNHSSAKAGFIIACVALIWGALNLVGLFVYVTRGGF